MHADDWRLVSAAFEQAVDLLPHERPAAVSRALAARDDLRPDVLRLLDATDSGPSVVDGGALQLLEAQAGDAASAHRDDGDLTGQHAGRVQLRARIASGGMGDVYLGEQPVGAAVRRVAVKVLKRGLDADALLARFRREQETLAALHHEGVVAFLDAGALPDGRPFLVMEHVEGAPLGEWCDASGAGVRRRVELVRDACAAVQFAHQELVLHRDLKPDNILVTRDGRTKLLDFGVAKLLTPGGERTDPSATAGAAAPLTWRYASPEQLRGERVSVATDVHALGLVLYELLARQPAYEGAPPLPGVSGERPLPPLPSEAVGANHRRELAGDLDAIVMRALHPEPARRYPSAERLADDLSRWLAGEPVSARRGRMRERAGRWLRRRRAPVAAAAALLLLLGALLTGTWIGKQRAEVDASHGWGAHAQARRATSFLEELLVQGLPADDAGRAALDQRVDDELARLAEAEALVRLALGRVALEQGRPRDAVRQLERALAIGEHATGLNTRDEARARELLERAREATTTGAARR